MRKHVLSILGTARKNEEGQVEMQRTVVSDDTMQFLQTFGNIKRGAGGEQIFVVNSMEFVYGGLLQLPKVEEKGEETVKEKSDAQEEAVAKTEVIEAEEVKAE
jgi:hypothetical protein